MPREALLTRTLVELADSLVQDFDAVDPLTLLDDRCVDVVDIVVDGLMLASVDGELRVVASSSEAMPVWSSARANWRRALHRRLPQRSPIVNLQIDEVDSRWPRFAPKTVEAGFRSVHPLVGRCGQPDTEGGPLDALE